VCIEYALKYCIKTVGRDYLSPLQSMVNLVEVSSCTPAFCNQTLLCDVQVKHVQHVIYGFNLLHFNEPVLDVLSCQHKYSVSVISCLRQHLQPNVRIYNFL